MALTLTAAARLLEDEEFIQKVCIATIAHAMEIIPDTKRCVVHKSIAREMLKFPEQYSTKIPIAVVCFLEVAYPSDAEILDAVEMVMNRYVGDCWHE